MDEAKRLAQVQAQLRGGKGAWAALVVQRL